MSAQCVFQIDDLRSHILSLKTKAVREEQAFKTHKISMTSTLESISDLNAELANINSVFDYYHEVMMQAPTLLFVTRYLNDQLQQEMDAILEMEEEPYYDTDDDYEP